MMPSTNNKSFHTYENVVYEDQVNHHRVADVSVASSTIQSTKIPPPITSSITTIPTTSPVTVTTTTTNNNGNVGASTSNKTPTIESPFTDPHHDQSQVHATKIFSETDSSGTTRMLTSRTLPGQNLVTKLITLPSQSPMDSIREWSVSTFKCTKQMFNEKRGTCSITNDAQLLVDIDNLREHRNKLLQILRTVQQMNNHYTQLVKTQRQMYSIMNEMCIKNFTTHSIYPANTPATKQSTGKHIVANFSSLGNNLSSTTTTSPTHQSRSGGSNGLDDFAPILNHIKNSTVNLSDDLKKNAISLNASIKNGEKLTSVLNFFSSNLSTLIYKTIEDTLETVRQYEGARLEYDAERNSLNSISQIGAQTSITYSSDKLELVRVRYQQLKENVQIKMKFLEENIIKVMHKQLVLFNNAFASYSNGDTASLDSILRQFSIK